MAIKGLMPKLKVEYTKGTFPVRKIMKASDAYNAFIEMYNDDTINYSEDVFVIYLNRANKTIGYKQLSMGGTDRVAIDVKMVAAIALKIGAHAVLLSHNHPSGSVIPGDLDKELTNSIKQGLELLDIVLFDHIIVSPETYFSFSENELI